MLGLWLRLGESEKPNPSHSCPEEVWSGSGGRDRVCVDVCRGGSLGLLLGGSAVYYSNSISNS